jgi:hypothetical protein
MLQRLKAWLLLIAVLISASASYASISSLTGFTSRADGFTVTASEWNTVIGGIYTYINGTIVTALNTLASKGGILTSDGSALVQLGNSGSSDNGKVLTLNNATLTGLEWQSPGGIGLTTTGDMVYYNEGNTRLGIGTSGQVLTVSGGLPVWSDPTGIPTGCIVMWSGSLASIPSGWHLCDGTNGTPNLQGLFIEGAGNVSPAATGGLGLLAPGTTGTLNHQHNYTPGTGATTATVTALSTKWYALAYIQKL